MTDDEARLLTVTFGEGWAERTEMGLYRPIRTDARQRRKDPGGVRPRADERLSDAPFF